MEAELRRAIVNCLPFGTAAHLSDFELGFPPELQK